MKHRHKNRILGRTTEERKRLLKNLQSSLLEHGSIVTTEARAKELRKFFEPLVTEARGELTLHRRRRLLRKLFRKSDLVRLLEVAESQKNRPGGYVRLTKLPVTRMDAAAQVRVDIVEKK
jgi:large subunit ribosomal protein L17